MPGKYDDMMFDGPIPGQSLTNDPKNPLPFEQPPQFNTVEEAISDIFIRLTEDGRYESIIDGMRKGIAIEALAQLILFKGFTEGKWTVDLKLLLIEPTFYVLMWLASEAGIEPVLEIGGDDWEEEENMEKRVLRDINSLENSSDEAKMSSIEGAMPDSLLGSMREFKGEM